MISGFLITLMMVNALSVFPVLADIPTHGTPVLVSSGGNTIYDETPDRCPVCSALREKFKAIE